MTEKQTTDLQRAEESGKLQRASEAPARKPMAHLRVAKGTGAALETLEDVRNWAQFVCQAGLNPPGLQNPSEVCIATLKGFELGVSATTALANIAVINKRPSVWGDLMLSLCYQSGLVEDFEEWIDGEGDERTAYCRVKRKGIKSTTLRAYSMADAKQAGLYPPTRRDGTTNHRSPWNTNPDRMQQMRARAFALRDTFPDFIQGLGMIEEVRDYEHETGHDATRPLEYQDAATDPLLTGKPEPEQQQEAEPESTEPAAPTDEPEAPDAEHQIGAHGEELYG